LLGYKKFKMLRYREILLRFLDDITKAIEYFFRLGSNVEFARENLAFDCLYYCIRPSLRSFSRQSVTSLVGGSSSR
jgi:hypothetical protein